MTNKQLTTLLGIAIVLGAVGIINISSRLTALNARMDSPEMTTSDVSSSTVRVSNGTTTVDVPLIDILSANYNGLMTLSSSYCQTIPTAEICTPAK